MDGMPSPPPFRLAAIDIDDTLVGCDKRISAGNRAAVERLTAAGCRVVLASGREHSSMRAFHDALGLDDFLVSSQGALVEHPLTGHRLVYRPVAGHLACHLLDEGLRREVEVLLYTAAGIFVSPGSPWAAADRPAVDATLRFQSGDLRALAAAGPLKVLWHAAPHIIARLALEAAAIYADTADVVVTAPELLEFNAPDATKGTAIAAVAGHYGIARDEVVAFGDGLNDIAMLAWAGCGVALAHAQPAARAAADLVAPEGDIETGLARAVALLFNGGHRTGDELAEAR
jgi:Cof subfamily protein (haloacid dehalogenase superfamily)